MNNTPQVKSLERKPKTPLNRGSSLFIIIHCMQMIQVAVHSKRCVEGKYHDNVEEI